MPVKRSLTRMWFMPLVAILLLASSLHAADWPMWRCDAKRSAVTSQELPGELQLAWTLENPPLEPAWLDEPRMRFDVAYEPIVVGDTLFVGSPRDDSVRAIATETGREKWRFYTDGPVRFAPAAWDGKLYVASDDGFLYCLRAETGGLLWKFRGGPTDRKVLGNKRLIGTWPVRGAPAVLDGRVYVAAGIWPFMGVFVYALDAETGAVVWVNDGTSATYVNQPHDSPAFAGVGPQGYISVAGDRVVVPGGRSVPAAFDRETGELAYFHLARDKQRGDYIAAVTDRYMVNSGHIYALGDGALLGGAASRPVYSPYSRKPTRADGVLTPDETCSVLMADSFYGVQGREIVQRDLANTTVEEYEDSKKRKYKNTLFPVLRTIHQEADRVWLKAGDRIVAGNGPTVFMVDLEGEGAVTWEQPIEGNIESVIAADGKLFVSTREGRIHCFADAEQPPAPPTFDVAVQEDATAQDRARDILAATGVKEGYGLLWGMSDAGLAAALAEDSALHLTAVTSEADALAAARRWLGDMGLYGERVAVHSGVASEYPFPPYIAGVIVVDDLTGAGYATEPAFVQRLFRPLRPYGGVACLELDADTHAEFVRAVNAAGLENAEVSRTNGYTLLKRVGALPGTDNWTHQYGNPANTSFSRDSLVKAPLGLLWFGGSSNVSILPRHGHGPPEQIVDGRLFIEGPNTLRANDVYTGRTLWQVEFPGLGHNYNVTYHQPGANSLGTNFVAMPDAVYVVYDNKCLRLDPATGETLGELVLPPEEDATDPQTWGFTAIEGDILIAGASPFIFEGKSKPGNSKNWDATCSKRLVAMDRHSGKVLWTANSASAFRHNAIAIGGGKLFCIDRLPDPVLKLMNRRGETDEGNTRLIVRDLRTGDELWSTSEDIFGTWLGYSAERDILLQAGRPSRDMLPDEPGDRIIAYRGQDGAIVWDKQDKYFGPLIIRGDTIITQTISLGVPGKAYSLLTGEQQTRESPITGEKEPWEFGRNYGCNTIIASEHLITFRSAAAGYYDLERDGGTANLGGFKTGCTSNLIAANGVLNAPDYTRTCLCSYQNQTSLAMIHDPDVEMWTFNLSKLGDAPVKRVGLNLGAPGDRLSDEGTLWLDTPSVGGPSPDLKVSVEADSPRWFRHHSSWVQGGPLPWVGASGLEGAGTIKIGLGGDEDQTREYTVRLYFMEPEAGKIGERVLDVVLEGRTVLEGLDVFAEAQGARRVLAKELRNVAAQGEMTVTLSAREGSLPPVLSGIEIIAEPQ